MELEIYLPLLSALAGALFGTFGTVAAVVIQARKDDRRHRREIAVRLASEQQAVHLQSAAKHGGGVVPPIDLYLLHALAVMGALEEGKLTKKKLEKIDAEMAVLNNFLNERLDAGIKGTTAAKAK